MESQKSPPLNLLEPLREPRTASDLVERIDEIVDRPGRLRPDALEARQWVAVPVETANHLDEDTVSRLLTRCKQADVKRLFAVETERDVTKRECYSLPASAEGLASFNCKLGLMYCALFPPALDWLILCTKDDHYVVAGRLEFVEAALAKRAGQALGEFVDLASDPAWSRAEREFLQGVAERYAAANAMRLSERGSGRVS
jgi:hypothetical protein